MKIPFLFRFRSAVFCDTSSQDVSYDSFSQASFSDDGNLFWRVSSARTNVWTAGRHVPSHRTPSGRWVTSYSYGPKMDKRAGK